jgi:hypothetical protein
VLHRRKYFGLAATGSKDPKRDLYLSRRGVFMSRLRVYFFAISLDGYGAGPNQDLNNPLGVGGMALHEWMFRTRTFRQMVGN